MDMAKPLNQHNEKGVSDCGDIKKSGNANILKKCTANTCFSKQIC